MRPNRSMPQSSVIPELAYPDVGEAARWLCDVFGFTVRMRIANHRVQLNVGAGAVVVTELGRAGPIGEAAHSVMVRVEDADGHHVRAAAKGARILQPPASYPYGERQYTAQDLAGHGWTFSQSIADVAPEAWGGTSGDLGLDRRLLAVMRSHGPAWKDSLPLERQAAWAEHAAFMDGLVAAGFAVFGGPLEGVDGALVVVRGGSVVEVRSRLAADPWVQMGLLNDTLVAPWTIRLGSIET